jgi:hypothetical protein
MLSAFAPARSTRPSEAEAPPPDETAGDEPPAPSSKP